MYGEPTGMIMLGFCYFFWRSQLQKETVTFLSRKRTQGQGYKSKELNFAPESNILYLNPL